MQPRSVYALLAPLHPTQRMEVVRQKSDPTKRRSGVSNSKRVGQIFNSCAVVLHQKMAAMVEFNIASLPCRLVKEVVEPHTHRKLIWVKLICMQCSAQCRFRSDFLDQVVVAWDCAIVVLVRFVWATSVKIPAIGDRNATTRRHCATSTAARHTPSPRLGQMFGRPAAMDLYEFLGAAAVPAVQPRLHDMRDGLHGLAHIPHVGGGMLDMRKQAYHLSTVRKKQSFECPQVMRPVAHTTGARSLGFCSSLAPMCSRRASASPRRKLSLWCW